MDSGVIHFTGTQRGNQVDFDFYSTNGASQRLHGVITAKGLMIRFPEMGGCQRNTTSFFVIGSPSKLRADVAKMTGAPECAAAAAGGVI